MVTIFKNWKIKEYSIRVDYCSQRYKSWSVSIITKRLFIQINCQSNVIICVDVWLAVVSQVKNINLTLSIYSSTVLGWTI